MIQTLCLRRLYFRLYIRKDPALMLGSCIIKNYLISVFTRSQRHIESAGQGADVGFLIPSADLQK